MNSTAVVIAIVYVGATVLAVLVALVIAQGAAKPAHVDHRKLARRENVWFVIVLALLLTLFLSTIWLIPYGDGGEARASDRQVVDVTAQQFAWVVDPVVVRAGRQVEFRLRATDVSHAFGLYDPDDKLVFQVQAGPGELQKEFQTLNKPGRYRIICLEFCGVDHHLMLSELTVR